jgi:hypothetical protein
MRRYIIIAIIAAAAGAAITKTYFISTKIETVEKEVIKDRIITVIKERKNPDGSSEKETIIDETKKEVRDKKETVVLAPPAPDWSVGLASDLKQLYRLDVQRRVVGPVHAGVWADTSKQVGLSVRIDF